MKKKIIATRPDAWPDAWLIKYIVCRGENGTISYVPIAATDRRRFTLFSQGRPGKRERETFMQSITFGTAVRDLRDLPDDCKLP